jgi:hypothetical protein
VNRTVRRKIAAEKLKIEHRLGAAVQVNEGGPVVGASNIRFEIADKTRAISHGGIGIVHRVVRKLGLATRIDERLHLLRVHKPYHESDHVLNIVYNTMCGGQTLDDIELRRTDRTFLDAIGARSLPDPTTAGDFCRRFRRRHIAALQDVVNEVRLNVWHRQPASFTAETARIDADGTIVATDGKCKEGMDISYNGIWGYHPLLVSLANTGEPLFIENRSGNRASHMGVVPLFDKAIALCRRAGFKDVLLRGDTAFSTTREFDRWTRDGVRFIFGYDAREQITAWADGAPDDLYRELEQRAERERLTAPRTRPTNVVDQIVRDRGFKTIRTTKEDVVDFDWKPVACKRTYRVVALRKNLSIERGKAPQREMFEAIRYFFYITNDLTLGIDEVIHEARHRCNQENLIEQLKNDVHALRAPTNTLNSNWAYMVMASIAWSLKAWLALMLPVVDRWKQKHLDERVRLLRMEFRNFVAAFIHVPAQIVTAARRITYRIVAWNRHLQTFFRLIDAT